MLIVISLGLGEWSKYLIIGWEGIPLERYASPGPLTVILK